MTAGDLRLQDYVDRMLDATRLAREYVASMSKADFLVDRRTQRAVVLNPITIGEIAARVMSEHPDFVANHPDIPWRQMRGMRNRMAHRSDVLARARAATGKRDDLRRASCPWRWRRGRAQALPRRVSSEGMTLENRGALKFDRWMTPSRRTGPTLVHLSAE